MKIIENQTKILKYQAEFKGVFTITHLKNLFEYKSSVDLYRQIKQLVQAKILFSFCRGIYVTVGFDLKTLSQRICPESYISMATVLANDFVIGTVPQQTLFAVKVGKTRRYDQDLGTVQHYGLCQELFFGYENNEGLLIAHSEKAFLDTLYFYQHGYKPYFNIYSDMNVSRLNKKRFDQYLKKYKNNKFIEFAKGVYHANQTN